MKKAALFLVSVLGCSPAPSPTLPVASPGATTAPVASSAPPATPLKLTPKEIAQLSSLLAQTRAKCTVDGSLEAWLCPDITPWRNHPLIRSGRAELWLFDRLGDPSLEVRLLAVTGIASIDSPGQRYRTDARLAKELLDMVEAIPDDALNPCGAGVAVGRINATELGLVERIRKLIAKSDSSVRQCFMLSAAEGDAAAWLPLMVEAMHDDADVGQEAAVTALGDVVESNPKLADRACAALLHAARRHALRAELAEGAATRAAAACDVALVTEIVALVDGWVAAKEAGPQASGPLGAAAGRDDAKLRNRAVAVARALAKTPDNHLLGRLRALTVIRDYDPKAKAFLEQLAKGPPSGLREEARELLGTGEAERVTVSVADSAAAEALWERVDALRGCYRQGLGEAPAATGQLAVTVRVDDTGKVSVAAIEGELRESMKQCVSAVVQAIQEPGLDVGEASWGIGFELRESP